MLRMSLRSTLRPLLRPIVARSVATHERGASTRAEVSAAVQAAPASTKFFEAKFLQKPAVWAAAALAGGGAVFALGHDAMTQVRRSESPTHVLIGHGFSQAEVRRRVGAFVDTLQAVEAVELHWWSPTTARVTGQYLDGDIRVRDGWVDVTMRVHGPLRVKSQDLHGWMVENLKRLMAA